MQKCKKKSATKALKKNKNKKKINDGEKENQTTLNPENLQDWDNVLTGTPISGFNPIIRLAWQYNKKGRNSLIRARSTRILGVYHS